MAHEHARRRKQPAVVVAAGVADALDPTADGQGPANGALEGVLDGDDRTLGVIVGEGDRLHGGVVDDDAALAAGLDPGHQQVGVQTFLDGVLATGQGDFRAAPLQLVDLGDEELSIEVDDEVAALEVTGEFDDDVGATWRGQHDVAGSLEVKRVGGVLGAGPGGRGGGDGAAVGVGIGLVEGDLAVAVAVGVAAQAGGQVVGEEAALDLVAFLADFVGRGAGDDDLSRRRQLLIDLDDEGRRQGCSLVAGHGAGAAGVDEGQPHVASGVVQQGPQLRHREGLVAQAQATVLGVARVVDEDDDVVARVFAVVDATRQGGHQVSHGVCVTVDHRHDVGAGKAPDVDQHIGQAGGVASRVAQLGEAVAAVVGRDQHRELLGHRACVQRQGAGDDHRHRQQQLLPLQAQETAQGGHGLSAPSGCAPRPGHSPRRGTGAGRGRGRRGPI